MIARNAAEDPFARMAERNADAKNAEMASVLTEKLNEVAKNAVDPSVVMVDQHTIAKNAKEMASALTAK